MFATVVANKGMAAKGGRMTPGSRLPGVSDELKKHLRENYPMLLDGALGQSTPRRGLENHALRVLARPDAGARPLRRYSGAALREALAAIHCDPCHVAMAGLTPVSPRKMWVWWSPDLLTGQQDDIIADLAAPRPVLRFYDITGLPPGSNSWNQVFDIDADAAASAQRVEFWAADRAYMVDLGLLAADGRFVRFARTNPACLPREAPGAPGTGITRVDLDPAADLVPPPPDAEAKAWFDAGFDWPTRDRDAELAIRMLYRAFLAEGPRALRRVYGLVMGSRPELDREHRYRNYRRAQRVSATARLEAAEPRTRNRVMVAFLDSRKVFPTERPHFAITMPERPGWTGIPPGRDFGFFQTLLEVARRGQATPAVKTLSRSVNAEMAAHRVAGYAAPWVRPAPEKLDELFAWKATSIFDAARDLGKELTRLASARSEEERGDRTTIKRGTSSEVGGSEGRRFARHGIRFTRMALSLEGRSRPGARFKVGGKVVQADAEGRFRVECQLSGRKTSIPLLGVSPLGLSAKSVVAVEWKKASPKLVKATS